MKLVRYGPAGAERPGLIDSGGKLRDLGGVVADIDATAVTPEGLAKLQALDPASLPEVGGNPRLGAPIAPKSVGKLVCVGLNYADHAKESGMPIPAEPVLFMKATSSITGPYDPVVMPRGSVKTDWEVELAFVIGSRAKYVSEADALKHVAGYCVLNDVSERTYQLDRGGQWTKGKSCDTYAPMGPWLVTPDEVGDVANLKMWLDVDGKRYQDGTTATMIFSCATVISYMSHMFTLEPGDVVTTGTPPGVGAGMKPQVFLKAGQTMVTGIEKLGEMRNPIHQDD
jgi:2,4-didehydro-3-deoxy-L-rhamnonate hydrolase